MGEIFNYSHDAKGSGREKGQIGHQFSGLARPSGRMRRASQTRQRCQISQISQIKPNEPNIPRLRSGRKNGQIGRQFSERADPPFASSIGVAGKSARRRQIASASHLSVFWPNFSAHVGRHSWLKFPFPPKRRRAILSLWICFGRLPCHRSERAGTWNEAYHVMKCTCRSARPLFGGAWGRVGRATRLDKSCPWKESKPGVQLAFREKNICD
ncbi:hypothetical protein BGZ61DRAFT_460590 [Ilyonectria robusta]|uniref:uncharacterized protein n=1 Tax=Ilyonectria robusta TaxID=1079257 RepID=UPI001E8DBE41|nr:uncharacterized protein BGZ61DRAFT_460590 [Ilyonectria robusta]KAH8669225.1 hypothetical protein BGZ61DRAFT_460590 [Ilyonectria robusta]